MTSGFAGMSDSSLPHNRYYVFDKAIIDRAKRENEARDFVTTCEEAHILFGPTPLEELDAESSWDEIYSLIKWRPEL